VEGAGGRSLTAADVVNDAARSARARVEGTVGGARFAVERVTRRKALARLTLEVDGEDRTGADARLTQVACLGAALRVPDVSHACKKCGCSGRCPRPYL